MWIMIATLICHKHQRTWCIKSNWWVQEYLISKYIHWQTFLHKSSYSHEWIICLAEITVSTICKSNILMRTLLHHMTSSVFKKHFHKMREVAFMIIMLMGVKCQEHLYSFSRIKRWIQHWIIVSLQRNPKDCFNQIKTCKHFIHNYSNRIGNHHFHVYAEHEDLFAEKFYKVN